MHELLCVNDNIAADLEAIVKDGLAIFLSEIVQHQVELQAGLEDVLRLAERHDSTLRHQGTRDQLDGLNIVGPARANVNRLGAHWAF